MQRFFFADLYEGLKLAQRGRLEDQRGTEIRFEMPDFLKRGTVSCHDYSQHLAVHGSNFNDVRM